MAADQQPQHEAGVSSAHLERQMKMRKRKGSLRKTALLGPGRSFPEKNNANSDARNIKSPSKSDKRLNNSPLQHAGQTDLANGPQQRQPNVVSNSPSGNLDPYISTTDEDESIPPVPGSFHRTMTSSLRASSESSGTGSKLLKELRETIDPQSELMPAMLYANSSALLQQSAEWDYSATERWGWIILVTTWIVFVVGMGSCLGVWSWAWDVGETPYAPPELEDDPTLPIVGYYPALIVLTAVMAWVWVIVAWVGMKYFKHAKIQSDDT